MTMNVILAALAAGSLCMNASPVMKSQEAEAPSIEESEYYFGVLDVPYADFYYGEINHIQPEALEDGTAGQYETEDIVGREGYREEGIYDAVTSATNAKSTRFPQSYYEADGDTGVRILGPSGVNVAISKALYEDVQKAIEAGTECSNPLLDFVSALGEVSETAPAEYKVINSDGTLSQTIGTTKEAENVTVSFATNSSWGNYQIDFEGLEINADQVQGALLETSDGTIYGLEHLDNLWLQPSEIAFAAEEMTEPHGNTPSYRRFEDIQGKTITKVTYMLANEDDISIAADLYCKELLPEEYSISMDETVTYNADGTKVTVSFTLPEECEYTVSAVAAGRSPVDESLYTMEDGILTLGSELKPGQYTVTFSNETYADEKVSVLVESGLEDGSVTLEDNKLAVAENEKGLTAADYIAAVSSVTINGEPVNGRGLGPVLFLEDGSVNFDAETGKDDAKTKIFDGSDSYELVIEATGYPTVTGTAAP